MCLFPKEIKNRRYIPNKKNGGQPPPLIDQRQATVTIGCNKCMECTKKRARHMAARLYEEIDHDKKGILVHLTITDENYMKLKNEITPSKTIYGNDNAIITLATRRFLERWRKKYKKSIKHFFVTELGQNNTERIHIHGLVWTSQPSDEINRIWQYGITRINNPKENTGYVNTQSINYITKYISKPDKKHKLYTPKILASPGIGKNFSTKKHNISKFDIKNTETIYKTPSGHITDLPQYFKNKIYTEEERSKIWSQKLDSEHTYINGHRIKKKDEATIQQALEHAITINHTQGYLDNRIDYETFKEEKQRKSKIEAARIAKMLKKNEQERKKTS